MIRDRLTMQEVQVHTFGPACAIIARFSSPRKRLPCCHISHSFCHDSGASVASHDSNLKQARTAEIISKVVLNLTPRSTQRAENSFEMARQALSGERSATSVCLRLAPSFHRHLTSLEQLSAVIDLAKSALCKRVRRNEAKADKNGQTV